MENISNQWYLVQYFLNWDFLFEFCYWNHYLNSMTINQQIDDSFVVFQFFDSHVWLLNNSFLMIVLFTKSFSPLFTQNQTKVWSLLQIQMVEVWFHFLLKCIWHSGLLGARNLVRNFLSAILAKLWTEVYPKSTGCILKQVYNIPICCRNTITCLMTHRLCPLFQNHNFYNFMKQNGSFMMKMKK